MWQLSTQGQLSQLSFCPGTLSGSQELAALQLTVLWVALPLSPPAPGVTKGKVLLLSQGNPQNQHRTSEGTESSSAKKHQGTGGMKNWTWPGNVPRKSSHPGLHRRLRGEHVEGGDCPSLLRPPEVPPQAASSPGAPSTRTGPVGVLLWPILGSVQVGWGLEQPGPFQLKPFYDSVKLGIHLGRLLSICTAK